MLIRRLLPLLCTAAALAQTPASNTPAPEPDRPAPEMTRVADGVYLFVTAPYSDVGLDGNAIAIVGDDGVLVFDANGTPAAAEAVLAKIREVTPQPVKYLVLSHWHWDHWYGAEVYAAAFPGLEIIAHEKSRALMAGPAIEFNRPGLETQLPAHIQMVEQRIEQLRSESPDSPDIARFERHLAQDRFFLEQKTAVRHTLPTRTFTDALTLSLGKRKIEVRHDDRAVTPGDAYLWLPDEKIVITGDLLVNPITFGLFCYPSGWITSLKKIDSLDPKIIIPGHGQPLRDDKLLKATIALLERETELARKAKDQDQSVPQACEAILADERVKSLRTEITDGDATKLDQFALYMVRWFVARVYEELEGPLDDSIPAMP